MRLFEYYSYGLIGYPLATFVHQSLARESYMGRRA